MTRAIDIANFTEVPTSGQTSCLVNSNYRRLIVGASFGNIATMQLQAGLDGHMELHAYVWLRHPFVLNEHLMIRAFNMIEGLPIEKLWIDVEDADTADPERVEAQLEDVRQAIAWWRTQRPDLQLGIYTAKWFWEHYMQGSHEDFGLPLWVAYYPGGEPDIDDLEAHLPGGWLMEETEMWQYAGTVETCGLNTDRNEILVEGERMKYTDQLLDGVFLEFYKGLGRQGALIDALANGLFAVARTVSELQTISGDTTQTIQNKLGELDTELEGLRTDYEQFKIDAANVAGAVNGTQPPTP